MSDAPAPLDLDRIGEEVLLREGIRKARAIRRLRPDPMPFPLLRKVCEAGRFAPSGGNRQPWIFSAVTEPERRAFVAQPYREACPAGRWMAVSFASAFRPKSWDDPDTRRRSAS